MECEIGSDRDNNVLHVLYIKMINVRKTVKTN